MAATAGVKPNIAFRAGGANHMDLLGLTKAQADLLRFVEVIVAVDTDGVQYEAFEAVFVGTGDITTSVFANMPIGSRIWDIKGGKVYLKTAAAGTDTWITFTGA